MFSGNEWVILILFVLVLTVPIILIVGVVVRGTRRNEAAGAANQPGSTSAVKHPGPPSGWFPDPSGRNDQRYWDGAVWTDAVVSGGEARTDPL